MTLEPKCVHKFTFGTALLPGFGSSAGHVESGGVVVFFGKAGIIGCRGMSELLEWSTSIEVRSAVSGCKVGFPYSEGSVNEEVYGSPAHAVHELCPRRLRQRQFDPTQERWRLDCAKDRSCGHQ